MIWLFGVSYLLVAMASISSMKMMDGEFSLASLKLFPINLLYITVSDESTSYNKNRTKLGMEYTYSSYEDYYSGIHK